MELYASENNFNIFYEKKRRELKNLQQLNEFVKPAPYFVYFMFKDTIHVDDYGSIKETLFKFPSMTRVSIIFFFFCLHFNLTLTFVFNSL